MFSPIFIPYYPLDLLKLKKNMNTLKKHLISSKEGELLAVEYENSNYAEINSKRAKSKPDSKSYIYELEILQDYINLIRDGMDKIEIKNKGIKISLGKYADSALDSRLNPLYEGYQTIFFSPHDLDSNSRAKSANVVGKVEELPYLNFGQLCPPH